MITGIPGNLGDGKSITMAKMAQHYYNMCSKCNGIIDETKVIKVLGHDAKCTCETPSPYKIHSNFWLNLPDVHYVTCIDDIEHIYNGFAFLDEFWSWIDSRQSAHSDTNLAVTGILHKSRKRGYHIVYESKLIHMTDRRIRELTDYILKPSKYINIDGELVKIEQNMLYPFNLDNYINDTWFIIDLISGDGQTVVEEGLFQFPLTDCIGLYDTKEEIKSLTAKESTPGVEKGIRIEGRFVEALKDAGYEGKITTAVHSRGWDVKTDKYAFDVTSPRKDRGIPIIELRGKHIERLLNTAMKEKLEPYHTFFNKGEWFILPMVIEHAKKGSVSTRKATKLKDLLNKEVVNNA